MTQTDESAERIIIEIMERNGFRHSKKSRGIFYKKVGTNELTIQTHFIDLRDSRMRIYGFERDGYTEIDREILESLYKHIRMELAAIGCADITEYEKQEDEQMSSRRNRIEATKAEDVINQILQRLAKLEEVFGNGEDVRNIQLLITTIRVQQEQLETMHSDLKKMMMSEGLKNSFLVQKNLLDEYKAYTENIMNPDKKKIEKKTTELEKEEAKEIIEKNKDKVVNDD